ncbi:hypothetical protein U1Q18_008809, partial [Sarracenia purpurea var. burkii]
RSLCLLIIWAEVPKSVTHNTDLGFLIQPVAPRREFFQSIRLIYTQIDESEVPGHSMLSNRLLPPNGRSALATIERALPEGSSGRLFLAPPSPFGSRRYSGTRDPLSMVHPSSRLFTRASLFWFFSKPWGFWRPNPGDLDQGELESHCWSFLTLLDASKRRRTGRRRGRGCRSWRGRRIG